MTLSGGSVEMHGSSRRSRNCHKLPGDLLVSILDLFEKMHHKPWSQSTSTAWKFRPASKKMSVQSGVLKGIDEEPDSWEWLSGIHCRLWSIESRTEEEMERWQWSP